MLTGLRPAVHGVVCEPSQSFLRLGDEHETLAEYLRRNGYSTAGVAANSTMLLRNFNLHQGFDYYAVRVPPNPGTANSHLVLREWFGKLAIRVTKPNGNPELYRSAEDINREVIPLIDQMRSSQKPFFLFINYMDVHTPYEPTPPYDRLFSTAGGDGMNLEEYYAMANDVMRFRRDFPAALRERLIARYDAELAYLDHHVGRLVELLKARKLFDNTLLIITSDHGEAFGAKRLVEHGVSVYQNQVHVPLLIKWPAVESGKRIQQPVSLIDIFPTVLEAVGLLVPPTLPGQILTKVHEPALRLVVAERYPCPELYRLHPRFQSVQRAAIWDRWKLIESPGGKAELYEIADETETVDKSASERRRVLELERQLAAFVEHERRGAPQPAKPVLLNAEEVERLKSLGYVQ
jgi:arylsulfatase A-like enzyme